MRFSLIVATLGRNEELKALFKSLEAQTCQDFEVIVIDQNLDDRLAWVAETGGFSFPVLRKRSSRAHLSNARNLGLQSAQSDIVAFPDDDCTYPPDLLAKVDQAFKDEPMLGVRTGVVASPDGRLGSGRWRKQSGPITIENVWLCSASINIFVRGEIVREIGGFDLQLGVGGPFGSGEDTDLVLRAVQTGWLGWYDKLQIAVHPDKTFSAVAAKRAFDYGSGLGYVLRKHSVPMRIWLTFMIRPMAGCLLQIARGKMLNAQYYFNTLRGRAYGYRAYPGASRSPGSIANEPTVVLPRPLSRLTDDPKTHTS